MKRCKQRPPVCCLKGNDRGRIKLGLFRLSNSAGEAVIARGRQRRSIWKGPLTVVRSLQGQAGLMMGKNLKLDLVGGVGQELGCFCQRAVLHAGAVDGQDVIAHVQSTTPVKRTR